MLAIGLASGCSKDPEPINPTAVPYEQFEQRVGAYAALRDSLAANSRSFDSVVSFGAQAIDRIIDASVQTAQVGNDLASQAVASYQPDAKNEADTMKYGMFAAAALVAVVILNKGTK
jgi:hypothetical protein